MLDQMKNIICQYVSVDPDTITEETQFIQDLAVNSYDLVNLVSVVEDEFDLTIPDRDIPNFVTLGDLIKYIEEKAA